MLTYLKLGAILGLALGLFGAGFYFGNLRGDAKANAAKTAAEAQRGAHLSSLASAWQQRELQTQAEDVRKNDEIDQLKNDALKYPIPAVRVCKLAIGPASAASAALPAANRASSAARVVPTEPVAVPASAGPDLGPFLSGMADYADSIVAACRTTQPIPTSASKSP